MVTKRQRIIEMTVPLQDMRADRRKNSMPGSGSEFPQFPDGKSSEDEVESGGSDILANTRRRYNSQDEFVYLLYNDIARILLQKWIRTSESPKSIKNGKTEGGKSFQKKGEGDGLASSDWKLSLPDEYVEIEFPNKNIYVGRVSRRQMEGDGEYRWGSGEVYKGEFEQNSIQGKGRLEWKDQNWYEGEFARGNRHGSGNLVSRGYRRFYTGQWTMGRKNGNGYCRYGENDDFYEGEWKMNKKQGHGYRVYENGTRYTGQWENDQRNGTGTMVWPNGDVYRGEWRNGRMEGYGDYVWNGFANESLSWPQENSYMGEWLNGMRHGRGILRLNSTGGGKYAGNWFSDKKHGYGMIIGNNGAVTEGDPLFIEDILIPLGKDSELIATNSKEELEDSGATKKQIDQEQPRRTKIFEPLHFPSLSFYVRRLLDPEKYFRKFPAAFTRSGKCHVCGSRPSCTCIPDPLGNLESESGEVLETMPSSSDRKSSSNSSDHPFCKNREKSEIESINITGFTEKEYEEHWVQNCLQTHMPNLRKVYKLYAELYRDGREVSENLSMGKIALWQLMRDCGIHKRGISLVQFQRYIASNKSAFINAEFDPFERIEFFQYIHSLLEVSWHLYAKLDDIETDFIRGRLAGGLHRLLVLDIFPNAGKLIGSFSKTYRDLLPIYPVYKLYREIGEPHTAKMLLRATCVSKGTNDPKPSSWSIPDEAPIPASLISGINAITVGERLRFIRSNKESMKSGLSEAKRRCEDDSGRELFAFGDIGAPKILSIISSVCPGIKDGETDIIVDMDYELTFLEFYEILIEATRVFLNTKKVSEASTIAGEYSIPSEVSVKSTTKSKNLIKTRK